MVDSYVAVPPDSSGKKVRTTQAAVGGETVQEEVVQIANASDTVINPAKEITTNQTEVSLAIQENHNYP